MSSDEFKSENLSLRELCERTNKKSYLLEEFGLLEFEMIWIPSKVNFYQKVLNEFEAKKAEEDEGIMILDSMIKSLEGN